MEQGRRERERETTTRILGTKVLINQIQQHIKGIIHGCISFLLLL
jgi:hypothetical protein